MSLLAGLLSRDARQPVDPSWVLGMELEGPAARPISASAGPFAVFGSAQEGPWRGDGSLIVAGDLDLVNVDELRSLTGRNSAAEALADLYEREGTRAIRRLRGAFALAIWDSRQGQLLLAVDHLGMRRLYYTVTSEGLAFASRPGVLRAAPGCRFEPDPTALYCYLNFGFVPAPHSIVSDIHRLEPGCLVVARQGALSVTRYWDLAYAERHLDAEEAARETVRLTEDAVDRALGKEGAKHTGAFLSGGTDSSTILGLMTRLTGERIHAFSIGFHERRYDELAYAERAARHFEAVHHIRRVSPAEALQTLPRLVATYDEPFGNNSAIGTFLCAQFARETGLTRLLAGDGGDEIFGGNERYTTDRIFARYHHIPGLLRRGILEPLLFALGDGGASLIGKAQRYVRRAGLPNPRRFYSYEFFFAQDGRGLLAPDFLNSVAAEAPWEVLERHYSRVTAGDDLNRLLYLDMKLTIGDNDLLKVTRTADAAGVSVRFPFLDLPLIEFTTTWPGRFKVRRGEKRWLFRRAFREVLPAATLAKPKHGFGVPTSLWLRTHAGFADLVHDALLASDAHISRYFQPHAIEAMLRLHASDTTPFYGDILWNVLMLELWHRHHVRAGAAR